MFPKILNLFYNMKSLKKKGVNSHFEKSCTCGFKLSGCRK